MESRIELSGEDHTLYPLLKKFLENPESLSEEMLERLIKYDVFDNFLPNNSYYRMDLLQFICYHGQLLLLQYLSEKRNETFRKIAAVSGYNAFRLASENGHLPVVQFFAKIVEKEQLQKMIATHEYHIFRYASRNGHLPIVQFLAEIVEKKHFEKMVAADNYYAFHQAFQNNYLDVFDFLVQKDRRHWNLLHRVTHYNFIINMEKKRYISAVIHDILGKLLNESVLANFIMTLAGFSLFFIPAKTIIDPFSFLKYLTREEQNRTGLALEIQEMAQCRLQIFSNGIDKPGCEMKKHEILAEVEKLEETAIIENRTIPGYSTLINNTFFVNKIRKETNSREVANFVRDQLAQGCVYPA